MLTPLGKMPPALKVLIDSSPEQWEFSGGGHHRTCQIHELLRGADIAVGTIPREAGCSNLRRYFLGLKFLLSGGLRRGCSVRLARHHGAAVARLQAAHREQGSGCVLVWEDTHRNNSALPCLGKAWGYKVAAVPANLENLVPRDFKGTIRVRDGAVAEEIRFLSEAAAVFCISREEQWWLALHGLSADFLPYYPPKEVAEFFLKIRARRKATAPQRWVILGAATYAPNFIGMKDLLETLRSLPSGDKLPVDIAGFETEKLEPFARGTNYRVHGRVEQEALAKLLVDAKGVLISQKAGAGALTRIPELLLAGVPVIANPIAARSAMLYEGVRIFDAEQELVELLQNPSTPSAEPPRPVLAEKRFLKTLEELANSTSSPTPGR